MIPIVSLSDLINSMISLAIGAKLLLAYRRRQVTTLGYFTLFYFTFGLMWLCWAAPEIIVYSAMAVTVVNIMGYVFLYAALIAIAQVPFVLLGRREWGALLATIVTTAGIVFVLGRVIDFQLQERLIMPPYYVYWRPTFASWLRILSGITSATVSAIVIAVFAYLAWHDRTNIIIFRRSLFIISSMVCMMAAVAFTYFLFLIIGMFWGNLAASLVVVFGLVLMLRGVSYGEQASSDVKKLD